MGITELLKKATNDILTEESLVEIEKAFNDAVLDKVKIHVEKALVEQDNDYANKLKHLISVIDKDHTDKLLKVVEAIDENHSKKLTQIVEKYNKELNSDAKNFKNLMVNNISTYLEAYLDEAIPAQRINEAVESKRAAVILEQIKEMLGVDSAVAKKAVRDAILDGKHQIDEANKKLEVAQKEARLIKEEYSKVKSELVLEKKLSSVKEVKKKDYLNRVLKGKTAEFITENFDYASNLFDKSESERLRTIKEEATSATTSTFVDRPVIVEERVQKTQESEFDANNYMSPYLTELKKF